MNIDRLAFNSTSKITLTLNVKQIKSHENERLQEEVAPSAAATADSSAANCVQKLEQDF